MATQTSTVWAFYKALRDRLKARQALIDAGTVVLAAPGGDPIPKESIQLFDATLTQTWAAIGNRRREERYTVRGGIYVQRRGARGDDEVLSDAVRDRVGDLIAEVEDELRVTPDVGMTNVRIVAQFSAEGSNLDQGFNDNGRWAAIDFSISVVASLVSS